MRILPPQRFDGALSFSPRRHFQHAGRDGSSREIDYAAGHRHTFSRPSRRATPPLSRKVTYAADTH